MVITSSSNPRIQRAIKLRNKRERSKHGLFVVEGSKEISLAMKGGYQLQELLVCEATLSNMAKATLQEFEKQKEAKAYTSVSESVYKKLVLREDTDGLCAVFKTKGHTLDSLQVKPDGVYLVIEAVEKPGNLGALLRTADGVMVDGVFLVDKGVDIYNPNVIRASIGTVFSMPVVKAENEEVFQLLKNSKIEIFAALPGAGKSYFEEDFSGGTAIALGNENRGLSAFWKEKADKGIEIPMKGVADSLNLSVSGAVLMYEILRQRSQ